MKENLTAAAFYRNQAVEDYVCPNDIRSRHSKIDDGAAAVIPYMHLAMLGLGIERRRFCSRRKHTYGERNGQDRSGDQRKRNREDGGGGENANAGESKANGAKVLHGRSPFRGKVVLLPPNCKVLRRSIVLHAPTKLGTSAPMSSSSLANLPVRLRRSVLSVPAINPRALAKVPDLDCDVVIFDLEDSVAPEKKGEARENLRRFFADVSDLHGKECVIRINGHDTGFAADDMAAVIACRPDAVLLPKVDGPQDVEQVADLLTEADAPEHLRIWAMMETPLGVLNAAAIARTGRADGARLDCLVVGLNDLRKATGVPAEPGRTFLAPWLMQVVLAARAFGLDVIDSVSNDFRDIAAFEAECRQGRSMGFDGKMLIHPAQIAPANRNFGPSAEEIADAQAIVEVFADPAAAGLNVVNSGGRMIERLHLEQARRLLTKVRTIQDRKGNLA